MNVTSHTNPEVAAGHLCSWGTVSPGPPRLNSGQPAPGQAEKPQRPWLGFGVAQLLEAVKVGVLSLLQRHSPCRPPAGHCPELTRLMLTGSRPGARAMVGAAHLFAVPV